ncbi:hypothetical protein A3841_04485 [Pontibacter flavimaris]|uniref:Uncharacterized protein n=1 Tax=Pontibacter flavimaris TaxID=1797110 RepID=A0A1Q5PAD8_9BACT|nr:hypothetical protein A3841_04485 [Pontibacter flavimaris]
MKSYEHLSNTARRGISLLLQLIIFGLMMADMIGTIWGGVAGGLLIAVALQECVMYFNRRKSGA